MPNGNKIFPLTVTNELYSFEITNKLHYSKKRPLVGSFYCFWYQHVGCFLAVHSLIDTPRNKLLQNNEQQRYMINKNRFNVHVGGLPSSTIEESKEYILREHCRM